MICGVAGCANPALAGSSPERDRLPTPRRAAAPRLRLHHCRKPPAARIGADATRGWRAFDHNTPPGLRLDDCPVGGSASPGIRVYCSRPPRVCTPCAMKMRAPSNPSTSLAVETSGPEPSLTLARPAWLVVRTGAEVGFALLTVDEISVQVAVVPRPADRLPACPAGDVSRRRPHQ